MCETGHFFILVYSILPFKTKSNKFLFEENFIIGSKFFFRCFYRCNSEARARDYEKIKKVNEKFVYPLAKKIPL